MFSVLSRFRDDEVGAVTVDWVVLTAAVVGMCVVVIYGIRTAAVDPADGIGAYLSTYEIE
ncbi:hypothetical protein [Wenxinia marina]|uniref:Flp pilus assembly protein, pilin Flp n=1 Tax=Wenxinia marina DSM 24838 TaxID=1123501 RepID=A0A0D0Q029_9RHOB|nr:hypothetical protein [Wenxinia marina]KIQ67969.1 hypothetical protein Wenmar_03424 [Wenxinia marina DSM 24838]GGL75818.1 hypothetical protein GCM10011392_33000 [Wenxinia marina]